MFPRKQALRNVQKEFDVVPKKYKIQKYIAMMISTQSLHAAIFPRRTGPKYMQKAVEIVPRNYWIYLVVTRSRLALRVQKTSLPVL